MSFIKVNYGLTRFGLFILLTRFISILCLFLTLKWARASQVNNKENDVYDIY